MLLHHLLYCANVVRLADFFKRLSRRSVDERQLAKFVAHNRKTIHEKNFYNAHCVFDLT